MIDVFYKIDKLRKERSWSVDKLAEEAILSRGTVRNIYDRGTVPSIATLRNICDAFKITLSEFFLEPDENLEGLTMLESEILQKVKFITVSQQKSVLEILNAIIG